MELNKEVYQEIQLFYVPLMGWMKDIVCTIKSSISKLFPILVL